MENSSHSLWGTEKQAQQLCVQRSAALHGDLLYFCVWPQQVWTFQGRNRNLENKRTQPFYSHQSLNDKHTTASVAREIRARSPVRAAHNKPCILIWTEHRPPLSQVQSISNMLLSKWFNLRHLCNKPCQARMLYSMLKHASLDMGQTITQVSSISSQWALGEAYDQCLGESLDRTRLEINLWFMPIFISAYASSLSTGLNPDRSPRTFPTLLIFVSVPSVSYSVSYSTEDLQ